MSRATASISRPVGPGPDGVQRGQLRAQHERVDLGELVGELARRPRARAVRAVAVEPRADVERHERVRRDRDVARRACGSAPRSPEATIDGKLGAVGAAARASRARARRATSRSVAPDQAALEQPVVDVVGERGGGADLLDLAGLLDRPLGLDEARRPARARSAPGSDLAQPRVRAHGQVLVLEAEPQLARPASPSPSAASKSCGACSRSKSGDLAPWPARRSGSR